MIIYKEIRANIAKRDAQNAAFDEEELSATSNRSQISSRNNRPLSQRSGGRPISGRCSSISGLTQSKSSSGIGGTIKMISDLLTDYNSPEDQMQLAGMYGRPRTVSNAMSGMILRVGELPSSADAQVTSGTGASDVNRTGLLVDAKNVGVDCSSRSNSEVVQSFRVDVMLNSVDDPVTQQPVKPPPFALVAQLISRNFPPSLLVSGGSLLVEDTDAMDENMRDETNLRLLGLYFPQLLHLCCSKAGRAHLVSLYWIEVALFSAASGYATVQVRVPCRTFLCFICSIV